MYLLRAITFAIFFLAVFDARAQETFFNQRQYLVDELQGTTDARMSPDDKHVYVASSISDTVNVYSFNSGAGLLTPIQTIKDGLDGVDGLDGAISLILSPDGKSVYVAGSADHAIAVFSRDLETGLLSFVVKIREGINGLNGLFGIRRMVFSPSADFLYAAVSGESAIAVFNRNSNTGELGFVEFVEDGVNGVDGLTGLTDLAVSADGNFLYASGGGDNAIVTFARDATSGTLSYLDALINVDGSRGVWGLVLSPDDKSLYAVSQSNESIAVFGRDLESGAISLVQQLFDDLAGVDGLRGATGLAISQDGNHVYVTARGGDNAVSVFTRDSETGELTFTSMAQDGVNAVTGLLGPYGVSLSTGNDFACIASFEANSVSVFNRDSTTGALSQNALSQVGVNGVAGLAGASSLVVSPDGAHVYVTSEIDDTLTVLTRDIGTGILSGIEVFRDGEGTIDRLRTPVDVAISPDGSHVYAAAVTDSTITVFERDSSTGTLTLVEAFVSPFNGEDGIANVESIEVSPDGNHLYAVGSRNSSISTLSRNSTTGELALVSSLRDNIGGVDGLANPQHVTLSPDGSSVYVASTADNAVSVFSRDLGTGALSFEQVVSDGVDGVDGLALAASVSVSPDGLHVYTTGRGDSAIALFDRDTSTGLLTFVEALLEDPENGIDGLSGAYSASVSPEGDFVYVSASIDDMMSVYSRDPLTGLLTFIEAVGPGFKPILGLTDPRSVVVSPDGRHIYSAGYNDNSVVTFEKSVLSLMQGTVTDMASGLPVACAIIELANGNRSLVFTAVTDVNGIYRVNSVPFGVYDVRVISPGLGEVTLSALSIEESSFLVQDFKLPAGAGNADISGIVTDADDGVPLVGVFIEASANDVVFATTYTCATGAFEIDVPNLKGGTAVRLDYTLDNYDPATQNVTANTGVITDASQPLNKSVSFPATIAGQVFWRTSITSRQEVLENAQITIRGPANATRFTDGQGIYVFDAVLGGAYTIRASAEGFEGQLVGLNVESGEVLTKSFLLLGMPSDEGVTIPGDLNGDGTVNAVDIQVVINEVLGITAGNGADVNDDGSINAVDIQMVINIVLGII